MKRETYLAALEEAFANGDAVRPTDRCSRCGSDDPAKRLPPCAPDNSHPAFPDPWHSGEPTPNVAVVRVDVVASGEPTEGDR